MPIPGGQPRDSMVCWLATITAPGSSRFGLHDADFHMWQCRCQCRARLVDQRQPLSEKQDSAGCSYGVVLLDDGRGDDRLAGAGRRHYQRPVRPLPRRSVCCPRSAAGTGGASRDVPADPRRSRLAGPEHTFPVRVTVAVRIVRSSAPGDRAVRVSGFWQWRTAIEPAAVAVGTVAAMDRRHDASRVLFVRRQAEPPQTAVDQLADSPGPRAPFAVGEGVDPANQINRHLGRHVHFVSTHESNLLPIEKDCNRVKERLQHFSIGSILTI